MLKRKDLLAITGTRKRSPVWEYFAVNPLAPDTIICLSCWPETALELPIRNIDLRAANTSTESLHRHLKKKHDVTILLNVVMNPTKQRKIDQYSCSFAEKKRFDFSLFLWLTKAHLPYSYVNNPDLKKMMTSLHPGYLLPSVETMKKILFQQVASINESLKTYLNKSMVSGSLSADGWTSMSGDSYFGLLLHFLDSNGIAHSVLLDCLPKESQTSENLAERVREVLKAWGFGDEFQTRIDLRRIQYFTTDTTASMPKMVNLLGMRWIPCIAHVLNLVVHDALKAGLVISDILKVCRKMCTYFSKSPKKKMALRNVQIANGFPVTNILLDVPTRWNSTLRMLESILKNKVLFHFLKLFLFNKMLI
jgi:hypothetical protein